MKTIIKSPSRFCAIGGFPDPRTVLWIAAALIVVATPARAGTITSDTFVAVARPSLAFLEASAAMAETRADNRAIRRLAHAETVRSSETEVSIDMWIAADRRSDVQAAQAPTIDGLGPLAGFVSAPFSALADSTSPFSPPLTGLPSEHRLDALGHAMLDQLAALDGAAFDTAFVARQTEVLRRLVRNDKDFVENGDDQTLRAIAVRNLPKVEEYIARLARL